MIKVGIIGFGKMGQIRAQALASSGRAQIMSIYEKTNLPKDINYTTYNLGLKHKSGLKVGLSVKEDKAPLLNVGIDKKLKKEDLEYNIGLSFKSNFDDSDIYNIKSEVKKWYGKFNIFGLYKHEYYNEKQDFQFKVGVGVKL